MKLSTDYENLLKHVVDGFNRNFFRNEFKEKLTALTSVLINNPSNNTSN